MLFTLGHGQKIILSNDAAPGGGLGGLAPAVEADAVSYAQATGAAPSSAPSGAAAMPQAGGMPGGPFGYFFPDADAAPSDADMVARLDALADAMVEAPNDPVDADSAIAPVFTYLGQFIDHDITANTDRKADQSVIVPPDGDTLDPLPRDHVTSALVNLRKGSLGLDSLYGDGPDDGPAATKLKNALRSPGFEGMMRLGEPSDVPPEVGVRPDLPADDACDLLRIGTLLDEGSLQESDILGTPLEPAFATNGAINPAAAVIGDARNDENLLVAQLHAAFLRFHNRIVVWLQGQDDAPTGDALFEKARELTRWHYQWLVLNVFLHKICDASVVSEVKANEAKAYKAFRDRVMKGAGGYAKEDHLPLPLEFSVAAFRFGHSMVRGAYDHNRNFGRGDNPITERASFDDLFRFTGGGGMRGLPTLPINWIIEWDRFVHDQPKEADHVARKIDTQLAPPLGNMLKQADGVFKHLAKRNLRRGHRLNIPSAQACIEGFNGAGYGKITPLSKEELTSGHTGQAVADGNFAYATPLWFYILREAEVQTGGAHLGQLGSRIVAETLVGLAVCDPSSCWHQSGSDDGRWHPQDGAQPEGEVVDDMPALMRAVLWL
ncbi:heme peroxidase family protein [Marivita sp. GX14005]|uniref:peroxidase family protein n=1 Tax=Marivita sp. GX14005 TaxID=2942276 RepID=UPI00201A2162|nr:heme peroxidase family protein [Marivita sp. GX14005]MCL3882682.1 heme peroxidase family protein [Marivita sp. GX14005]